MGKQITQFDVNRKILAFQRKWKEEEKRYKTDINLLLWDIHRTSRDWDHWAKGHGTPEEMFGSKNHRYVGWSKSQFQQLHEAAQKVIKELMWKYYKQEWQ